MIKMYISHGLLLVMIMIAISSCAFSRLSGDLERFEKVTHVFSGSVTATNFEARSIVVIALHDLQGSQITGFEIVANPGPFAIISTPQPMWLFAFEDLNRDLAFQINEPYGWGNNGQSIDPEKEPTDQLLIEVLTTPVNFHNVPVGVINNSLADNVTDILQIQVGKVSLLSDPLFSEDKAEKGLWQPFAFMEEGGAGIHFLEEYDPNRIPVLFVHGISDTPRRFTALIESLDHSRYQAWVFSYPSGWYLSRLSHGMCQLIGSLNSQYKFDQLHIIAHSMGGLVSRGALNYCVQDDAWSYLQSYTTISTPWNGVASARTGAKMSPIVVPVWKDLDPNSDFITSLFDQSMPGDVPHNLIFGFRQDSFFGSESSDGVISLSSQLRIDAQEQASQLRGYDEDHTSILTNSSVIMQINGILEANSK